ncbi:MAG: bifunctional oligoribonuclease/PAP phosphatase NrnA [Bacteroidota bacterium]
MNQTKQIIEQIKKAKSLVITSHKSPDGDSIGSSMALYQFCKKINPQAQLEICHPDPAPKFLTWLEEIDVIVNFEEKKELVAKKLEEADLIFALDFNEPSRLGNEMGEILNQAQGFKVMIDHHLNPSGFADINWSDTSSCSTCQMIYELIEDSENLTFLDEKVGTPIYLGIMTDTGSFRFNSVKAKTHLIVANLIERGVKHDEIHENTFDDNTTDKLKLRGFATSEKLVILENNQVAYISLSEEELSRFKHDKGDTEGLVNVALSIKGVKIAVFFSEKEGEVKISFRSKGRNNPINMLANEHFNGGGHANAAGGKIVGSLDDAIKKFIQVVPNYL